MTVNFQNPLPNAQNPTLMPNVDQAVSHATGTVLQNPGQFLVSNPRVAAVCDVTLSTNPTNGDVLTLTLTNPVLVGGSLSVSFTASSDTTTTAAAKLAAALTSNAAAMGRQIFGTCLANVLTVHQMGPVGNSTALSFASTGSTTAAFSNQSSDTVTVGGSVPADKWTALFGGSATEADVITLRFTAVGLPTGHKDVSITAPATPTLAALTTAMQTAVNADTDLAGVNITAPSITASTTLNIASAGPVFMTALSYTQGSNTETITITHVVRETIVLRFSNADFSGGHEDVSHLVVNGDTLATIAAALNSGINADSVLQVAGISSTVNSLVITVDQAGPDFAILSNQTSGSPGETLTIAATGATLAGGSGPVIPFLNFVSTQNQMQLRFRQGQPVKLSIEKVATLCATGSPIL